MALLDLFIFIPFFGCRLFGGLFRRSFLRRFIKRRFLFRRKIFRDLRIRRTLFLIRSFRHFRLFRFRRFPGLRLLRRFFRQLVRLLLRQDLRRFLARRGKVLVLRRFSQERFFRHGDRFGGCGLFVLRRFVRRFDRSLFQLFLRRSRFFRECQAKIGKIQLVRIDLRQHGRLRLRGDLFFRLRLRQWLFRLLFDKLFREIFRQRLFRFRLGLFGAYMCTGVFFLDDLGFFRRFGLLRRGGFAVGKRRFAARYRFAVFPLDLQNLTHRRAEAADDRRLALGTGFVKHALIPVENALALGSVKKRQQAPQLRHEAFSVQRGTPPIRTVTICHR